jgi:hypothetical protein
MLWQACAATQKTESPASTVGPSCSQVVPGLSCFPSGAVDRDRQQDQQHQKEHLQMPKQKQHSTKNKTNTTSACVLRHHDRLQIQKSNIATKLRESTKKHKQQKTQQAFQICSERSQCLQQLLLVFGAKNMGASKHQISTHKM